MTRMKQIQNLVQSERPIMVEQADKKIDQLTELIKHEENQSNVDVMMSQISAIRKFLHLSYQLITIKLPE